VTAEPDPNPYSPPPAGGPPRRVDLSGLGQVALVAAPLTLLASGSRVWLGRLELPAVPPGIAAVLVGLVALGVVVGLLRRRWEGLWPACLLLPLALLSLPVPEDPALQPVVRQLRMMAVTLLGSATLDAAAAWAWLEGRRGLGANALVFAALFSLRAQLITAGMQFLLPGLAFGSVLALLPVTATRHPSGWFKALLGSFGGGAWATAVAAWLANWGVWLLIVVLSTAGDLDRLARVVFDPLGVPVWVDAAADSVGGVVFGLGLAVAGRLYDDRRRAAA
jgi:hypothetical protein